VIDIDEISTTILDKTIARRKAEVPRAQEILQYYQQEYYTWLEEYKYSLHIKSWKDKLQELSEWQPRQYCEMASEPLLSPDRKAQKAVTRLAVNLRTNQEKGCQFINAINDYLQMS
jgi:glutamyl-tRNA reductase